MELIQIITTVLIFGSGLLFVVVLVSFMMSKIKEESNHEAKDNIKLHSESGKIHRSLNKEELSWRNKNATPVPKIFQLEQFKPPEVKTIRKRSSADRLSDEKFYAKEIAKAKTKSSRYTIVNDQVKKSTHKAMNFYF